MLNQLQSKMSLLNNVADTLNSVLPQEKENVLESKDENIIDLWNNLLKRNNQSAMKAEAPASTYENDSNPLNEQLQHQSTIQKVITLYQHDHSVVLLPFVGGLIVALTCIFLFKGTLILLLVTIFVILIIIFQNATNKVIRN